MYFCALWSASQIVRIMESMYFMIKVIISQKQSSWDQHGIHLGPVSPRRAPCWSHKPCYQGCFRVWTVNIMNPHMVHARLIIQNHGTHKRVTFKSNHTQQKNKHMQAAELDTIHVFTECNYKKVMHWSKQLFPQKKGKNGRYYKKLRIIKIRYM